MKALSFGLEKKKVLINELKTYLSEELCEDIGELKAELFYNFIQEQIGKNIITRES